MDRNIILTVLFTIVIQSIPSMTTLGSTDQLIQCGNLTCSNNAKCNNRTLPYKCQCHAGYMGETCSEDRDECVGGNPCYHRGQCYNTIGSWWKECCFYSTSLNYPCGGKKIAYENWCDCLDGWNGTEHCGENITESRLCMPGWSGEWCENCLDDELGCGSKGLCKISHRGEYYCSCQAGYGRRPPCSDVDECIRNPCKNSGTCINTVGSYICACASGWAGSTCSDEIDECFSNPCQNQGICIDQHAAYKCNCTTGWQGQTCTDDIDECKTSPCSHSGTCTNTVGSFQCDCPPEWAGQTCSENNICYLETPCYNAGTCTSINETIYQCHCPDTWKGVNCTVDVDECAENKCKHVESCSNTIGSYSCNCTEGWGGDDCDTDVNECETLNPCNNTLVCVNTDGGYECRAKTATGDSSGLNIGIIAGVSAGALAALLIAVFALLYKFKWKRPASKVSDVNSKDL